MAEDSKNKHVYIVDDDEAVCDAISELLASVGIDAETYTSAHSFLEQFDEQKTGCVVLDIRMSEMDGLSLQSKLINIGVKAPVIFITGSDDLELQAQTQKNGAFDFIQKPFHNHDLLESINRAFRY